MKRSLSCSVVGVAGRALIFRNPVSGGLLIAQVDQYRQAFFLSLLSTDILIPTWNTPTDSIQLPDQETCLGGYDGKVYDKVGAGFENSLVRRVRRVISGR